MNFLTLNRQGYNVLDVKNMTVIQDTIRYPCILVHGLRVEARNNSHLA